MKLTVLLSTYNGAPFLREQLDSLRAQTLDGVGILARDDGSGDGTRAILEEYRDAGWLEWTAGERCGSARSFWKLLQLAGDSDYYAFCDQDDVWDADKLEIAVKTLEASADGRPALYCSDVRVTDAGLNPICGGMVKREPADFVHATLRNLAPGCTYVFNRPARERMLQFDAEQLGIELHDWTAYQIAACFGRVHFDEAGHMSYRQHGDNQIGARSERFFSRIGKIPAFWNGPMENSRSRQAFRIEKAFSDRMSRENREWIGMLAHYRTDREKKRRLLGADFRISRTDQVLFRLLIRFNKL